MNERTVPPRSFKPVRAVLELFSSVYLAIFWMIAILIYATLGSAVPVFRQFFELTEFQYFNHWVFVTIIGLFCLNLVVATVRRIRFNIRNLGVLMVHAGLLVLCGGAVIYFGGKIEGDIWLDTPKIQVISLDRFRTDADNAVVGQLIAAEGETWEQTMPMLGGRHRVEVVAVRHSGMRTASVVRLKVDVPDAPEKIITLEQDNPDREHSRLAMLTDRLALMLVPSIETDVFFDDTTPALIVAMGPNEKAWPRFELPELPYYNERFVESPAEGDDEIPPILDTAGRVVQSNRIRPIPLLERWRMPIPLIVPGSAAAEDWPITLEIDGYLPYADLRTVPREGGETVHPIVQVEVAHDGHAHQSWLLADQPEQSMAAFENQARVEFRWIGEADAVDPAWTRPISGRHVLEVHVKDRDIRRTYDVTEGQTIRVEGTDYTLTIESLRPDWPLMTGGFKGARTPIALVLVQTPERTFQRSVMERFPKLNQDRYASSHPDPDLRGKKISETDNLVDENIELTYTDASQHRFVIVAGENLAPTAIHTAPGGKRNMRRLPVGETFAPGNGPTLRLSKYFIKPRFDTEPVVIPQRRRRSLMEVRRQRSLVRVHLQSKDGTWSRRVWVPFSNYDTLVPDGGAPTPVRDVPGLKGFRLVYGRATRRLPTTVRLERLVTEYYPGRVQPREWTSYFRYTDPKTGQVLRSKAFLNNTARIGDWTLFQSGVSRDNVSWTVLGVGNRRGILAMLVGCTLISLGMAYAFCVKPVLVRRRRRRFGETS